MEKFKELFENTVNEAKDLTRQYDGFVLRNTTTGEETKYPYRKGVWHRDVEDAAFREQVKLTGQERWEFGIFKLIKKGEWDKIKTKK